MCKLQVLVATMHQKDFSLAESMNLCCDGVFANQADRDEITFFESDGVVHKMVTTSTRGVGLNRNIGLMAADGDILLFADDDIRYYDGTLQGVKDAFDALPDADMIIFGTDLMKNGEITERRYAPTKPLSKWNAMKYGTYSIAVRRKALIKHNITFNQLFGGGCIYGSGEDSLFILDCYKNKLKVYSHSYVIGTRAIDDSTWFKGFNAKYFFDKGAFFRYAFPKLKFLAAISFALKMALRKKTELSFFGMIKQMNRGWKAAKSLQPFSESV